MIRSDKVQVAHYVRTADSIGGDWCHYFLFEERWLYVVCADVTGHGVGSGLISSAVAGAFECLKAQMPESGNPDKLVDLVRFIDHVVTVSGRGKFLMTMGIALIDLDSGVVSYVNAGHVPFAVIRRNPVSPGNCNVDWLLRASNMLGFEASEYVADEIKLHPGDRLVAMTDGLIERRNTDGKMFGRPRLGKILRTAPLSDAESTTALILERIQAFCGPELLEHFENDASLIVVSIPESRRASA